MEQNLKSKDLEIFDILKNVMKNCWCFEPKDRFSMKKVCECLQEYSQSNCCLEAIDEIQIDDLSKIMMPKRKISKDNIQLKLHFPPFRSSINKYTIKKTKLQVAFENKSSELPLKARSFEKAHSLKSRNSGKDASSKAVSVLSSMLTKQTFVQSSHGHPSDLVQGQM